MSKDTVELYRIDTLDMVLIIVTHGIWILWILWSHGVELPASAIQNESE